MAAFIYIPGGIGAILCMVFVHRMGRTRGDFFALAAVVAFIVLSLSSWSLFGKTESDLLTPVWFQEMLGRLQFSEHRLMPSWWLSSGLLEAARTDDSASCRGILGRKLTVSFTADFQRVVLSRVGCRDGCKDLPHQL